MEEARGNVETIIKELHLPVAKKTIVPMNEKAGFMGGAKYIHVRNHTVTFMSRFVLARSPHTHYHPPSIDRRSTHA